MFVQLILICLLFNVFASGSGKLRHLEINETEAEPTCEDVGSISFGLCMMHMGYGVVNGTCQGVGGCGSDEYTFFGEVDECNKLCNSEKASVEVEPTCEDVGSITFGMCMMHMGYGVVNGVCQGVGGCGSEEYTFFDTVEACNDSCKPGKEIVEAEPTCEDIGSMSFGPCKMLMGWGIVNGTCQDIGGCGSDEYTFFGELEDCESACQPEEAAMSTIATDEVERTCEDVGSVSFGMCKMHMGYGVINGTCQGIGGCGSDEYTFFDNAEDCLAVCMVLDPKFGEAIDIHVSTHTTSSVNESDAAMSDNGDNADVAMPDGDDNADAAMSDSDESDNTAMSVSGDNGSSGATREKFMATNLTCFVLFIILIWS